MRIKSIKASTNYETLGDLTKDLIIAKGQIDNNIYVVHSQLLAESDIQPLQVKLCQILEASTERSAVVVIDDSSGGGGDHPLTSFYDRKPPRLLPLEIINSSFEEDSTPSIYRACRS